MVRWREEGGYVKVFVPVRPGHDSIMLTKQPDGVICVGLGDDSKGIKTWTEVARFVSDKPILLVAVPD